LRRESESKNDSVVGLTKDDQELAGDEQNQPIRESHERNPLLEEDYRRALDGNDAQAKSQTQEQQ
jgi:hypothetical protein